MSNYSTSNSTAPNRPKPNRKLRVLFSIGSMHGGGSERQLVEILKRVDRSQFVPHLYLVYATGSLMSEVPDDVVVHSFDASSRAQSRISFPGWMARQRVAHMAEVIKEQKIDVVYNRTWMMTLIAVNAARWANTPCVSVAVANPVQDFELNAGRFRWWKYRLLRRAYRHSARVVAVSEGVRQSLATFFNLPVDSVMTLHNPVDASRVQKLATDEPDAWDESRFHLTCIGRLSLEKGYDDLIAAVALLVKQKRIGNLLVHVFGVGAHEETLKEFVENGQLGEYFRFEGFSTNPFPNLAQSQLFCLPSRYEGMPNALLEAMAVGVPVLSTDCESGPREITQDGQLGRLVPVRDPVSLADAIADAMTDYPNWQALVSDAKLHVEREYAPTTLIPKLEQLIIDVATQ